MTVFPPLVELVPHKPPMVLLDRVLSYSTDFVACEVEIGPASPFVSDGRVPAVVAMEYMAQCVAVFAGLAARENGQPPRIGFLLGSRDLQFAVDEFRTGDRLTVEARRTWGESDLGSFACQVKRDAQVLAHGTLTVFQGVLPEGMAR
jgi:predicted hotdog family 3-hydroxylacyl-ACP dehydratase